ncbi:MAG TPA: ABC transporter permease [Bryobacteraceae bacterium]|nr:ABC transporter permease [Bryobacteraceae bacterium]
MNFRRVASIPLRQFYLYRGSAARFVPLFAWVTVDMILWGFMTKFLSGLAHTSYRFVPALLGAVLFWDFMTRVMQGVTTAFFEDVWSRNFLNVFATPLTMPEYIGGLLLTSLATSLIGLAVMIAVATAAFGLNFASYGATLLPFVLVLFLNGMALGVAAIAIVLRFGPAAEWFVWPIPALLAPFACVYYPLSTLPAPMQWLARLLPPSYVFEGMRAIVAGQHFDGALLAAAFALAVAYIFLAYLLFARVFRHAVQTGLIARYSAETVS